MCPAGVGPQAQARFPRKRQRVLPRRLRQTAPGLRLKVPRDPAPGLFHIAGGDVASKRLAMLLVQFAGLHSREAIKVFRFPGLAHDLECSFHSGIGTTP